MSKASPAALSFLCTFSLWAQIATNLHTLPDGSTEVRLRNNSTVNLEAFAIRVSYVTPSSSNNTPIIMYIDPKIDSLPAINRYAQQKTAGPVLPGHEFAVIPEYMLVVNRKSEKPLLQQPIITAGIFAGGATTGDKALLSGLMLRRSNMLLAVETTLETLSDAGNRNVPRDQLIDQFKKMAGFVRRGYLPSEQRVGLGLYQSMIGKLRNLPGEKLGSPFPPSAFVAEETAMLRRQRATLSESLADAALIGR